MKLRWYRIQAIALAFTVLSISACGGGSAAEEQAKQDNVTARPASSSQETQQQAPVENISEPELTTETEIAATPQTQEVLLKGTITFDRVLFGQRYYRGLDYDNIVVQPSRGVSVQLLDANGTVLRSTQTDTRGHYQVRSPRDTPVQVRVLAQLQNDDPAFWDIAVRDNTRGNAQYVMDGSLLSSGQKNQQTRDLHAASGWTGDGYGGSRSAAPFAILDSIYDAVQAISQASPYVILPPLTVYWSEKNIAIKGDAKEGHIGTSYFSGTGPSIYILGAADNDSDEFDRAVIQHEFGHYIEHQISRSESIGGSHNQNSRLDMRVAFGEAWGNAFAGMVSGDPLYRDSLGAGQALGFTIDVETRGFTNQGWFSEASIQSILYDLYDANNDGIDNIELGFKAMLDVLASDEYLNYDGFSSIYPFITQLKLQQPEQRQQIDALVESFDIYGKGWYGEGETNDGGSAVVLPLYHKTSLSQTVNVCSDSDNQDSNGMDVRRFVSIDLPQTRSYDIRAYKTHGLQNANPQLKIYKQGSQVGSVLNGTPNREDAIRYLAAGSYIFEVYEQSNADGDDRSGGLVCFDVTIE